jgi:hypothetical protein
MAIQHLNDPWLKLVQEIHPRVAANSRTEIIECCRSGSRPVRTISSCHNRRCQHPEQIRRVQYAPSRVVTCDQIARNCVADPAHNAIAGRSVITQITIEQRPIQVRIDKSAGLLSEDGRPVQNGKARLHSGTEVCVFIDYCTRIDRDCAKVWRGVYLFDKAMEFLCVDGSVWSRSIWE